MASPAGAWRTSPGRSARDRFAGGPKAPLRKVAGVPPGTPELTDGWRRERTGGPRIFGRARPPFSGRAGAAGRACGAELGRDCSQCRPPVSARPRPGRAPEGAPEVGEEGRSPTRPVLKHGPRSLTRARVAGSVEACGRSEGEGRPGPPEVGSRRPGAAGAPPADLVRSAGEVEQERTRWDPKDGELCLSRTKPEETLVEVRSDSDVQIDRRTWV